MRNLIKIIYIHLLAICCSTSGLLGQAKETPLRIFGYFQVNFTQETGTSAGSESTNSFNMQQLNLLFQKNLAKNWSAFVNMEALNNFSSSKEWGAFNLEEAWVKYRGSKQFNLKLGLMIPEFNHLNTIKNRMPLLPYIIRPVVYENSFEDIIDLDSYLPRRAFAQAYGFIPSGRWKFDYAVYLGNSPNINDRSALGQTGVDTTDVFMTGGRLGFRYKEWRMGWSATYDRTNEFGEVNLFFQRPPRFFNERPRLRTGTDFFLRWKRLSWESETIAVNYDEGDERFDVDRLFYYATLGFQASDALFMYYTYWGTEDEFVFVDAQPGIIPVFDLYQGTLKIFVPSLGFSYGLNDRITLKGQFSWVDISSDDEFFKVDFRQNVLSLAISAFF